MIPYTIIKEVNADEVKGSATGAINFLVFTLSALMAPVYGWVVVHVSHGGPLDLVVFRKPGIVGGGGARHQRETGKPAQPRVLGQGISRLKRITRLGRALHVLRRDIRPRTSR
jgi:hypothetical protein